MIVTKENYKTLLYNNENLKNYMSSLKNGDIEFDLVDVHDNDDNITILFKYNFIDSTKQRITRVKQIPLPSNAEEDNLDLVIKCFLEFCSCEKDKHCTLIPIDSYVEKHILTPEIEAELLEKGMVIQKEEVTYEPVEAPIESFAQDNTNLEEEESLQAEKELDIMFATNQEEFPTVKEFISYIMTKAREYKKKNKSGTVNAFLSEVDRLFDRAYVVKNKRGRKKTKKEIKEEDAFNSFVEESPIYDPNCDSKECTLDNSTSDLVQDVEVLYVSKSGEIIEEKDIIFEDDVTNIPG